MSNLDHEIVSTLRDRARQGYSVGAMFDELTRTLGGSVHIVDVLAYFRAAFLLPLKAAKPIAALSRSDGRHVTNEQLLEDLVMPEIQKRRSQWDESSSG